MGGIAPAVAATTTVCAYDRAGHGRSDEAGPQDGIALATDLHTLLERAGVAGPYVLVGHSSGGPYVRVFAARYPDEVAGMVLLDAQPADAFTALPEYPGFYAMYRFATASSPSLARIGLLGPLLGLPADESSPAPRAGRATRSGPADGARAGRGAHEPRRSSADRRDGGIRAGCRLGGGPGPVPRLSTDSVHRVMATATHNSLISGVDTAASTQAILDVLDSVRAGAPLQ